MKKKWVIVFVGIIFFTLSSCSLLPGTTPAIPTATQEPITAATATQPEPEVATLTVMPSPTSEPPTPTAELVQIPVDLAFPPDISGSVYLDDRSTPAALILSYYNAVNKHEYLRAYSYWDNPATALGSYNSFAAGYADTESVSIVLGQISSGGAAGSIYYTVPLVINSVTTSQVQQKYAACYNLRLPQPGNYGAPPINPMHIIQGTAKVVALTTSDVNAIASACTGPDFSVGPNPSAPGLETLQDISNANYIDNRSGSVELISSYFNALNRNEIVRAYSYWKTPAAYSDFETEYTDWGLVSGITFGETTSDAGAGQMYFQTPVVISRVLSGGTTQVQSACFVLHLSQPTFQASPPFDPLGINSLNYNPGAGSADPLVLLSTACQ